MEKSNMVLRSVILRGNDGFSALCLDTDVASDGLTLDEAKENLREAMELYVGSAIENNLPIIRPVPREDNPLLSKSADVVEDFALNVNLQITIHLEDPRDRA